MITDVGEMDNLIHFGGAGGGGDSCDLVFRHTKENGQEQQVHSHTARHSPTSDGTDQWVPTQSDPSLEQRHHYSYHHVCHSTAGSASLVEVWQGRNYNELNGWDGDAR